MKSKKQPGRREREDRARGPEPERVKRSLTVCLTALTTLSRVRFMEAVDRLLRAGAGASEVGFDPAKPRDYGLPDPSGEVLPRAYFVALPGGGFLCGDCNAAAEPGKRFDVADPAVELWEFFGSGWLAPCVCGGCGLSLPVYVEGDAGSSGYPSFVRKEPGS